MAYSRLAEAMAQRYAPQVASRFKSPLAEAMALSPEEEALQAMSPIDSLKLRAELENKKAYTPEQASANLRQTGSDLAYSTPILGNIMSAMDVPGHASETAKLAGSGDMQGARKSMIATELAALGAIPFSPFGGMNTAGAASRTNIFAGPMAKTADHAALENAKRLAQSGATRDEIWKQTGWFTGKDGKWRFEIPDNAAADVSPMGIGINSTNNRADRMLYHPEYYKAYPDAADMRVQFLRESPDASYKGMYYDNKGWYARGNTPEARKSVSLHEMQHDAQAREGFPRGASLDYLAQIGEGRPPNIQAQIDFLKLRRSRLQKGTPEYSEIGDKIRTIENEGAMDAYYRTSGEVEARNVQTRMNMTPAERRAKAPWLTQDVPDEQQIVRRR